MGLTDGGSGLLGGLVQSISGPIEQNAANEQNFQMAADARTFDANMADTQYQRGVQDLKAAGLNPILATGSGAAAPSPTSPSPAISAAPINMPDFMAYGVSLKNLELAQQKLNNDTGVAKSQIMKNLSDTDVNAGIQQLQKMGFVGKELGTDTIQTLKQGFQNMIKSVKQPPSPSGGGDFPAPNNGSSPQTWDDPMLQKP